MLLEFIEKLCREAEADHLGFLMIGGHALAQHGYVRLTRDVDFLGRESQRASWHALFAKLGYRTFSETPTFVQYSPTDLNYPAVDIMFVEDPTWEKLRKEAVRKPAGSAEVLVPCAEHLVALKLFAASNPKRRAADQDWIDVQELVRICRLDPSNPVFADLVRRYGGEEALERVRRVWQRIRGERKE